MRYFVFDTETTGLGLTPEDPKQAVEIAMLEIGADMSIIGEASSLIMPTCEIGEKAASIHGITMEALREANAPTVDDWVMDNLGGRLEGEVTLIGHRIGFDKPLFAPIGDCVNTLDTLTWAYELFPEAENKKLDTLKEYLGLAGGGQSHRAMADVMTCFQLLQKILDKKQTTLTELIDTRFTVHYCPWGRHAGKRLMEVPRKYREWMLSLADLEPNLRASLEVLALVDPPPLVLRKRGSMAKPRIFIPRRNFK